MKRETVFTKENTSVAKGVAILLMIFHHLFNFPDRLAPGIVWKPVIALGNGSLDKMIAFDGKICVAIFIFLSGYGMYFSSRKIKESNDINRLILSRIAKLYKLFLRVFIIFVPLVLIVTHTRFSLTEFVLNITGFHFSYNKEWWFLTPYILIIFFHPVFSKLLNMERSHHFSEDLMKIVLLDLFVYFVLPELAKTSFLSSLAATTLYYNINLMLTLLPSYLLGIVFARYSLFEKVRRLLTTNRMALLIIYLLIILITFWFRYKVINAEYLDFAFAPIAILCGVEIVSVLRLSRLFSFLGRNSATMWLVHTFFCYQLIPQIIYAPRYSILIFLWLTGITTATAVLIPYVYDGCEKTVQYLIQNIRRRAAS